MISKLKKFDFEIIIFLLCLFLQDFSIIKTKSFGIPCLTLFLVYAFFRYNFFKKLNKKFIIFCLITIIVIVLSSILNKYFNYTQIFRYLSVLFIFFAGYNYIKILFDKKKNDTLLKYALVFSLIISLYGVYQSTASMVGLPMFLNIFNNNPSYAVRGIYEVYGGWSSTYRVYGTFFEPSVFAIFLSNLFFIFLLFYKDKKLLYYITMILLLFNIFLTFARSGWIVFLCYLIVYILYRFIFKKLKKGLLEFIFEVSILLLPLFIVVIMYFVGLYLFKDNSSLSRTYSSIYYLTFSFQDILSILFGHSLGSLSLIKNVIFNGASIEPFAHNGYVEIIYLLGWPYFIYLLFKVREFFTKTKNNKLFAYATISTLCCFGAYYNVESLAVISIIFICYTKFYKGVIR